MMCEEQQHSRRHEHAARLARLETSGAIKIAGAMYNLATGSVAFLS
jgi:hypothetical protein